MLKNKHIVKGKYEICVPHVKPPLQPPNQFHLLLQRSGTHCQIICYPFQLFLLLEELSNITYSCLLTLTVVRNLVRSNQLNVSHFLIHRQLLPSRSPEIPCRTSKGVPSERLRLVKWFFSHRLHTGTCVNLVLITYLLTFLLHQAKRCTSNDIILPAIYYEEVKIEKTNLKFVTFPNSSKFVIFFWIRIIVNSQTVPCVFWEKTGKLKK